MKTCFNCQKEFDTFDEPVHGFYYDKKVVVCKNCAETLERFDKQDYDKSEVYKRFEVQYADSDDPVTFLNEYIIRENFDEAYEYAKEKYGNKLIGINFDAYVNINGRELTYNDKTKKWYLMWT